MRPPKVFPLLLRSIDTFIYPFPLHNLEEGMSSERLTTSHLSLLRTESEISMDSTKHKLSPCPNCVVHLHMCWSVVRLKCWHTCQRIMLSVHHIVSNNEFRWRACRKWANNRRGAEVDEIVELLSWQVEIWPMLHLALHCDICYRHFIAWGVDV